jgi:hypothetical protein
MADPTQKRVLGVSVPHLVADAIELVIQIAVAVVVFLAIGAAAVALNLATDFCERGNLAPRWALLGMRGVEMLLWALDATCFSLFVIREAWDFCVRILGKRT